MAKVTLKINIDLPGLRKELDQTIAEIKGKLSDVGEVEIDAETSDAIKGINNVTNAVEKTDTAAKTTTESFANWGMIVTGLNQAVELISKTIDLILVPIEDAGQFEQYEAALTVMLGSTEAAKMRLEELVEFAANTPFELPQVIEAGNQLQAIGRYSQETLTMLGDLASASGKSFDQVLNAYAKMASGQKGIAIDMFRDLLVTTDDWVKATGKQLGKNGELQASVEEMAEALPRIIEEKGFAGMMDVQSKTLNGMVSNFEDGLGQLSTKVGQLLLPLAKQIVGFGNQIVSSLIPAETHLEKVEEKAFQQRYAFERLVAEYEQLRQKSSLTNIEQSRFSNIITELQSKYPTLLSNLDLQKGKLEDVRAGFQKVREEIEANIRAEVNKAKAKDLIVSQEELIAKQAELNEKIIELNTQINLRRQGTIEDKDVYDQATEQYVKRSELLQREIQIHQQNYNDYQEDVEALQSEIDKALNKIEGGLKSTESIRDTQKKSIEAVTQTRYRDVDAQQREVEVSSKVTTQLINNELKYTKVVQDEEEKRIDSWKSERDAKEALLQHTIASGIASAHAEESLSAQLANIARNTIKRIIAEGIAYQLRSVFMTIPFPFSLIAAAAAAEAVGALVDSILPKFETGGLVDGKKHKDGGKNINVEGGEYIFDANTVEREPQNFEKLHSMLRSGDVTLGQILSPNTPNFDPGIITKLSNVNLGSTAISSSAFSNSEIRNILIELLSEIKELRKDGPSVSLKLEDGELKITNEAIYKAFKFREKIENKRKVS